MKKRTPKKQSPVCRGGGNPGKKEPAPKRAKKSAIFGVATKIAKGHGISVIADQPNLAKGDCLFESLSQNINNRECFENKVTSDTDELREICVSELEKEFRKTDHYPGHNNLFVTDEQLSLWDKGWAKQKVPREFNVDHCNISDLTAAGIGHCVNKHILVFNTTNDIQPVTVYCGNYFDKTQNVESEIPIILAYDGQALHYESLLPKSELDIKRSISLVKAVLAGTYDKNDPKQHLRLTDAEKKANRAEYDKKRRSQGAVHDSEAKRKKLSREQETVEEKQDRLKKKNEYMLAFILCLQNSIFNCIIMIYLGKDFLERALLIECQTDSCQQVKRCERSFFNCI